MRNIETIEWPSWSGSYVWFNYWLIGV